MCFSSMAGSKQVKEIALTQGQVSLVDDDDFERVNMFKWHALREMMQQGVILASLPLLTFRGGSQ